LARPGGGYGLAAGFHSTTGRWWGVAESGITQRDHDRVALVRVFCGSALTTWGQPGRVTGWLARPRYPG